MIQSTMKKINKYTAIAVLSLLMAACTDFFDITN